MQHYSAATLIYVGRITADNGSPKEVTVEKPNVKVRQIRNFSLNYYTTNGGNLRSMRNSRNLVVAKQLTEDIKREGVKYELMYVRYNGLKYRVKEVLNYWKTDLRVILDCEEVK